MNHNSSRIQTRGCFSYMLYQPPCYIFLYDIIGRQKMKLEQITCILQIRKCAGIANLEILLIVCQMLLMLAGDIETNPGPKTKSSHDVFRTHTAELATCVSSDLYRVTDKLYANGLIALNIKDEILTAQGVSDFKKASKLVHVLDTMLDAARDPDEYFNKILDSLIEINNQPLTEIANVMRPGQITLEENVECASNKRQLTKDDVRKVKKTLRRNYLSLSVASKNCLPHIAELMYSEGLISESTRDSASYRAIIDEFEFMMELKDNIAELKDLCQSFLSCLLTQGGPPEEAARKLAKEWKENVFNELNVSLDADSLKNTNMPEQDNVKKNFRFSMKGKSLYICCSSTFIVTVLVVTTIIIVPLISNSLYVGSEVSSPKTSKSVSKNTNLFERPSVEERIWIESESGEDVVKLCIEKIEASGIFPKDTTNDFMRRIAYTMSRDGNPPFQLTTDGGIWQVSLYAFSDTKNTEAHIRLNNTYNDTYISKYTKIKAHFDIDWPTVRRVDLAIPFYSALAARLYLSNFAESFPPCYDIEKQSQYWWNKYLLNHESKQFYSLSSFNNSINELPPGCLKKKSD